MNARPAMMQRSRQLGAVLLFAAMGISALIVTASLIDLGLLYQYRREYQKTADLAALAGAQALHNADCAAAESAAILSANRNIGGRNSNFSVGLSCGIWQRENAIVVPSVDATAVEVVISGKPPSLFSVVTDRILSAKAIALSGAPVTTFSVGTRLASVAGDSVVGNVLGAVGLDLGLNLLDYDNLAGVNITPRGLLSALGIPVAADISVGGLNELLAAEQVSLGDILDATVVVAGQSNLLSLNAALLNALRVPLAVPNIDNIDLALGSSATGNGLFASINASNSSALDVSIDALDLISTAISVATSGRAIDVAVDSLPGLGILGLGLSVKVGVTEPPSIGIGGVGAQAYSAQTRVFAHLTLDSSDILGPVGGLLSRVLDVSVDLPIVIDVASATGTVEQLCTQPLNDLNQPPACPGGEDCADIEVDAQLVKICVGNVNPNTIFSTAESCDVGLGNQPLLGASLLGSSLISLNTKIGLDVGGTGGSGGAILAAGQQETVPGQINLGTTVTNLTDALLAALLATGVSNAPPLTNAQRDELAEELWNEVGGNQCPSGLPGRGCRGDRLDDAEALIANSITGLGGFLANAVLNPVVGLLSSVLTLDLLGILGSVGDLLGGVLGLVGNLLAGVLGLVTGNQCTGGGLLNPAGSNSGCVNVLADALKETNSSGALSQQAGITVLLGQLLNVLKPVLDAVGNDLLVPLLTDILGLRLGETDVSVFSVECNDGSVLVY